MSMGIVMNGKKHIKVCVDFHMILLLPMLMAYSLIGEAAHEWLGLGMILCFVIHQILNIKWYQGLCKGRYTPLRTGGTILNFLLLLLLLTQAVSGILMSRYAIPVSGMSGMSVVRILHLLGSHWGFVLMSLHLGFHWSGIARAALHKRVAHSPALSYLSHIAALLVAAWGAYVFVDRQMAEYLFLRTQFVFFDFGMSRMVFVTQTFAMMGLFCFIGYYLQKVLRKASMNARRRNEP